MRAPQTEPGRDSDGDGFADCGIVLAAHMWLAGFFTVWFFIELGRLL